MGAPAYIVVGLGELEICAMLSHMLCCVRNEKRRDHLLKMNNAVCRWAKRFRLKNHTFWSEL